MDGLVLASGRCRRAWRKITAKRARRPRGSSHSRHELMQLSQVFRKSAPTRGGRWGLGRRDCTHRDCICVRNGLPGWGGWIRTSAFQNRNSQDSQPGRRDSNLCISKSSITADLDHQFVASGCSVAVLHHSRCGSPQPASPSPTRPRRSLKNRAVPRGFADVS